MGGPVITIGNMFNWPFNHNWYIKHEYRVQTLFTKRRKEAMNIVCGSLKHIPFKATTNFK